jgi:hypothetical protein
MNINQDKLKIIKSLLELKNNFENNSVDNNLLNNTITNTIKFINNNDNNKNNRVINDININYIQLSKLNNIK